MNEDEIGLRDVYTILLDMKQGFGRIEASVNSQQNTLAQHMEADKELAARILELQTQHAEADRQMERRIVTENIGPVITDVEKLKLGVARNAGALKAVTIMGSIGGAIAGAVAEFLSKKW